MNRIIFPSLILLAMSSCFTGIESTPKITADDVKKEHIVETPEQRFLADLQPENPARWHQGKRLLVTDPRIEMAMLASVAPDSSSLAVGSVLTFVSATEETALNGDTKTVLKFENDTNSYRYTVMLPLAEIMNRKNISVPFTIDLDLVNSVAERMRGKNYYIKTPAWYDASGAVRTDGLRHIRVEIVDVVPGNSSQPLRIVFSAENDATPHSVFMSLGQARTSTRNFDTLFSFENPRTTYPHISDRIWQLIMHSKVETGMTRDECRLALGNPDVSGQRPTTAGMVEYWSYSDGKYLLFEEGLLSSFRK